MELKLSTKCFGGEQRVYHHPSAATGTDMEFAAFLPSEALAGVECPTLFYLSGLTCTWENVTTKAAAQAWCAEQGVIFVAPDTSPRGEGVADDDAYDLGQGAGFYLTATEAPWAAHFNMYDYVTRDLYGDVLEHLPVLEHAIGITGHSMGGHGALTIALKNQDLFRSVSAFAPIVSPINCPWGQKALTAYLGPDQGKWAQYDACALVKAHGWTSDILVDQGGADGFLEGQLKPWLFDQACREADVALTLRMLGGYDHSYYFIASVIRNHIEWHAERLMV